MNPYRPADHPADPDPHLIAAAAVQATIEAQSGRLTTLAAPLDWVPVWRAVERNSVMPNGARVVLPDYPHHPLLIDLAAKVVELMEVAAQAVADGVPIDGPDANGMPHWFAPLVAEAVGHGYTPAVMLAIGLDVPWTYAPGQSRPEICLSLRSPKGREWRVYEIEPGALYCAHIPAMPFGWNSSPTADYMGYILAIDRAQAPVWGRLNETERQVLDAAVNYAAPVNMSELIDMVCPAAPVDGDDAEWSRKRADAAMDAADAVSRLLETGYLVVRHPANRVRGELVEATELGIAANGGEVL